MRWMVIRSPFCFCDHSDFFSDSQNATLTRWLGMRKLETIAEPRIGVWPAKLQNSAF